jgi:hypothetical protein
MYDGQLFLPNGVSISLAEVYASGTSVEPAIDHPYSAQEIVEQVPAAADGTGTRFTVQRSAI